MRKATLVCMFLILAVCAVFGQTLRHGFVNFDDDAYVTSNQDVREGLWGDAFSVARLSETVGWAFCSRRASNWHPVTWLSHALDCQIFGLNPLGHHLVNVLIHGATAVLLFWTLHRMTRSFWPSAAAVALFAVHPLRVESVAWIAERKDLLCGLFFVLSLAAYLGYVRHPFSWRRYALLLVLFALGLMSKPMIVTLPFVLLLLDYWPLGRVVGSGKCGTGSEASGERKRPVCEAETEQQQGANAPRSPTQSPCCNLILEKLPLFALSAISCGLTLWAQAGAIGRSVHVSLPMRLGNAAVSYVEYLGLFFWPANLAVLYPHHGEHLPLSKIAVAVGILVAITMAAWIARRRRPYFLVGWLWFLGMLTPAIGLVQVGEQAMADRYTYLPQIGVCIIIAWWGGSLLAGPKANSRAGRLAWNDRIGLAAFLGILAVLSPLAWRQTSFWHDSESLWTKTLDCTKNNFLAHYNLGVVLAQQGKVHEALRHYDLILAAKPDYIEARYNRAVLWAHMGRTEAAIPEYRAVLRQMPDAADAHFSLAESLARQGELDEAKRHYREAIRITPDAADAYNNVANIEMDQGLLDQAEADYQQAIRISPRYADAHNDFGALLSRQGRFAEAAVQFRIVLQLDPGRKDARQNLQRVLRGTRGTP